MFKIYVHKFSNEIQYITDINNFMIITSIYDNNTYRKIQISARLHSPEF